MPGMCTEPKDDGIDSHCKPEEVYDRDFDECFLPGPCWDDTQCDTPYECRGRCYRSIDAE